MMGMVVKTDGIKTLTTALATIINHNKKVGKINNMKLFIELFAWSVVALVVLVVLALLGVYKIFL